MADIEQGLVKQLIELIGKDPEAFSKAFSKVIESGQLTVKSIGLVEDAFEKATQKASEFGKILTNALQDPIKALRSLDLGGLESIFEDLKDKMAKPANQAKAALLALNAVKIRPISEEIKSLGRETNKVAVQFSDLAYNIKGVPSLSPLVKVAEFAAVGDHMKNLENLLLKNAAAAGDLGDMVGTLGKGFAGMDDKLAQFSNLTKNIGDAAGMTSGQVAKYYVELQKIPGALDEQVSVAGSANQRMHMLDATIRVARGSFRDVGDVIKDLTTLYDKLGMSGKEPLAVLARMHDAAQKLNLPFDKMHKLVSSTAQRFMYFGRTANAVTNNLQGAIDIMSKMGPALKNYGLGPEAIEGLVSRFVQGIGDLGMAQKAFLAGQTGAPGGGLKGAFEIDLMLREGDLEGVYKRVETALRRQFGGRIVSLEEAAASESAAAQMAKQVQLLTSGPLKMVESTEQAYALLAAMAAGETIEETPAERAQDALKNTIQTGDEIRERQYNALVSIHNELKHIGNLQSIVAYAASREAVGAQSGIEEVRSWTRMAMEEGRKAASGQMPITGRAAPETSTLWENLGRGVEVFDDIVKGATQEVPGKVGELLGLVKGKGKAEAEAEKAERKEDKIVEIRAREEKEAKPDITDEFLRAINTAREPTPGIPSAEEVMQTMPPNILQQLQREMEGGRRGIAPATAVRGAMFAPATVGEGETRLAGVTEPARSYSIDVVCSNCAKQQFKADIDGVLKRVESLESDTAAPQRGTFA